MDKNVYRIACCHTQNVPQDRLYSSLYKYSHTHIDIVLYNMTALYSISCTVRKLKIGKVSWYLESCRLYFMWLDSHLFHSLYNTSAPCQVYALVQFYSQDMTKNVGLVHHFSVDDCCLGFVRLNRLFLRNVGMLTVANPSLATLHGTNPMSLLHLEEKPIVLLENVADRRPSGTI